MANGDTPGFMSHLELNEDGSDKLAPLKGDILSDETPQQTATDKPKEEKPVEEPKPETPAEGEKPKEETKPKEEKPPEDKPKEEEEITYNATEILAKKPEERTEEEKKALTEGQDVLTDEQKKQLADEVKAVEEAKPKVEEILAKRPNERTDEEKKALTEATLTDEQKKQLDEETKTSEIDPTKVIEKTSKQVEDIKNTPSEKQSELQKAVIMAGKFPLAFPTIPKKEDFTLEDGKFDIEGWGKVFANNIVMSMQQSLTGGPLSAAVFGILMEGFKQEQTEAGQAAEKDSYATGIYTQLVKNYPILGTDKDLEETFDTLLQGEFNKRAVLAEKLKAEGKEPSRMEYADFEKLLTKLIGKQKKEVIEKPDGEKTETLPGGVNLNAGGTQLPKDEIDEAISGMMQVKSKVLF